MGNAKLKDDLGEDLAFADELAEGSTLMHGQYTIVSFLNAGGFGITYSARDSLDRHVVIKECFPGAFCRRSTALVTARSRAHQSELASIVRLFVQEARSLAKLNHPNIVGVHQVFEENNTAYMALDFVEGRDLLEIIEGGNPKLKPEEVETILRKVLDAIGFVHEQGLLHRDISPDNILLDKSKNPVLIDFGAAREQATKKSRVLSALRVVKDGYSPQEFYISGSEQGPYSDLYALGASFYHLITGELPPDAQTRLSAVASGEADPYRPLVDRLPTYRKGFLTSLDTALEILPKNRIPTAEKWLEMLDGNAPVKLHAVKTKYTPAPAQPKAGQNDAKSKKGLLLTSVAVAAVIAMGVVMSQSDLLSTGQDGDASIGRAAPTIDVAASPVVQDIPTETAAQIAAVNTLPPASVAQPAADPAPAPLAIASTGLTISAPTAVAPSETVVVAAPLPSAFVDGVDPFAPIAWAGPASSVAVAQDVPAPVVDTAAPVIAQTQAPVVDPVIIPQQHSADAFPAATLSALSAPAPLSDVVQVAPAAPVDVAAEPAAPVAVSADIVAAHVAAQFAVPDATAPETSAPSIEVVAVVPAPVAEVAPVLAAPVIELEQFEVSGMQSAWSVALPGGADLFDVSSDTRLFAVNAQPVASLAAFETLLRETIARPANNEVTLALTLGETPATAQTEDWVLPVVHKTVFPNGLAFEATAKDGAWETRVTAVPAGDTTGVAVGDLLFGHLQTTTFVNERTTLPKLAERAARGETDLGFAINRDGNTLAIGLKLGNTISN